ncbi:uncharacterized protein [Macrobrachium rosenbergii]|uniref:uncharacterized protein n=1 Tax=Macrobrachium rosenbergii TaxID=79674 RepID=UPI0034D63B16
MKTVVIVPHLLLVLLGISGIASAAPGSKGYNKYCSDLSPSECRFRGQRCFKVLMPLMSSLTEHGFIQECADKFNITGNKLKQFRAALAISFRDSGGYILEEMSKEDLALFLPYQNCTYTMDGLLTESGLDLGRMRSIFNRNILQIMAEASPEFRTVMVEALNSCPDSSLEENLPDCLLPSCMTFSINEESNTLTAVGNQTSTS